MAETLGLEYKAIVYDQHNRIIGYITANGSFVDEPFKPQPKVDEWFTFRTYDIDVKVNFK